jgi:hypothetical protein
VCQREEGRGEDTGLAQGRWAVGRFLAQAEMLPRGPSSIFLFLLFFFYVFYFVYFSFLQKSSKTNQTKI